MLPDPFRNALILTGPTGSGKTALGVELASGLGAEIVSMDSMAVYRGMDIGTAKPSPEERRRVRHHLLDVLDPWESASVAWWLKEAARCVREIEQRGKRALIVGGTPLYLKALLRGFFNGPPADAALRQRLTEEVRTAGSQALHERLARVDPVSAARLHPHDVRRVIRALEVWELTGQPISAWQKQWSEVRSRKSEVRSQKSEVRSQKSEVRDQKSEIGSLGDEVGKKNNSCPEIGTDFDYSSKEKEVGVPEKNVSPLTSVLWLDLPRTELYARIDARVHQMIAAGLVEEVRALRNLPQPISREAAQALGYQEICAYLDNQATLAETITRIQTRSRNFAKRQLTWFRHLPECRPVKRELTFAAWGLTIMRTDPKREHRQSS
jgi:tRNA dimethylallyltransferase